jgi:hypothetical protein
MTAPSRQLGASSPGSFNEFFAMAYVIIAMKSAECILCKPWYLACVVQPADKIDMHQ